MINAVQLGNQLRSVRKQCGLTQQAVADELGIPRSAVANIESGKRAVSTLELTKFARAYDCSAASFLGPAGGAGTELLSTVLFRALPGVRSSQRLSRTVRRLLDLYREGAVLRRMLNQGDSLIVPDRSSPVDSLDAAIKQGEQAAREERRRLNLGSAPIRNIARIISDAGIWAVAIDFPGNLSGLFVSHPDVGMAILVNQSHPRTRRRFSYAHEYAHALFDRTETVTVTRRKNSNKLTEVRANTFAAAFLMPAEGIAEQLAHFSKGRPLGGSRIIFDVANNATAEQQAPRGQVSRPVSYQDVALLARHFGVSYEGVVWRLKSLNHISGDERVVLMGLESTGVEFIRQMNSEAPAREGTVQATTWESELRGQLLRLTIEAFRLGEISPGRVVEIGRKLKIDRDSVLELAYAACSD